RQTCRSQLAGDGDLAGAFAGKPGSYKIAGEFGTGVHAKPVGAGLLAMAISRVPSPASLAPTDRGRVRDWVYVGLRHA
ncbi:hypothetical protein, partial [Pseudomonas sp. BF-RE-02]|uniref:hypothetical protein n=1 Tax=Pseudomonas sp. BF-RE-02 TaxID=2832360 RepID=UPI001CBC4C82